MLKKLSLLLALSTLALTGCEEEKKEDVVDAKASAAVDEQAPPAPQPAEETEEDAEEAERKAEAEKEQAEVEANPLTECCRALGKKGFTLRSPEYMAASKACGESLTAEAPVSTALVGIKKALKEQALPEECNE